ncbi:MAG TPA: YceI family protein [Planctomycetota bacterium]|nr:YceI family protein [Planctomycetota bacterium]
MASKLLAGIGVLAILGLVGGSLAALAIVKQRVHVTIAAEEEAAQRGPDPIELLRADVGVIGVDVAAFNESLGARFQELHDALESSASQREKALAARIDALETKLKTMQASAAANDAALAAAIKAQADALASAKLAVPIPEIVIPDPAPIEATPPAVEPTPPAPEPAAPVAPPKKGFLGFQPPSAAFAFDQRQRFAIVPTLSRVGFDAKSTLHDFSGLTSKVDGNFSVNLSKPADKPLGTISAESSSLDTGLADRDKDMHKSLGSEQFKTLEFQWTGFTADQVDAKAMTISGKATGKLSIRGVSQDITLPVKVSVDASKRVVIEGETKIKMSDYAVVPPSQLGVIKVEDEVKIWIALRARLLGPAKEGE